MGIPEHPDIARALRTGYPRPYKSVRCKDCQQEFSGGDQMYIDAGDIICGKCLKDRLLDAYGIADLAAAFDIQGVTVEEYLEEG